MYYVSHRCLCSAHTPEQTENDDLKDKPKILRVNSAEILVKSGKNPMGPPSPV